MYSVISEVHFKPIFKQSGINLLCAFMHIINLGDKYMNENVFEMILQSKRFLFLFLEFQNTTEALEC